MQLAIIDCGAGNLHSVRKAFAAVLPKDATLDIVTDSTRLAPATHIVLPGVGAFADCMRGLNALPGMREALERKVLSQKTPFLGICVGMQMLFTRGHEYGVHDGLGWFEGEVMPLAPSDKRLRIPHMGWNTLALHTQHPFLAGIAPDASVYFVHSFAVQHADRDSVLASVDYGGEVVSIIGRGNLVATQFHPEKSQKIGLQLLTNFLQMK